MIQHIKGLFKKFDIELGLKEYKLHNYKTWNHIILPVFNS